MITTVDDLLNLSEDLKDKIHLSHGKNTKQVQNYIRIIKEWVSTQKHLPEMPCDNVIANVLFGTKFSVERAKTTIDNIYTIMSEMPEFYLNTQPHSEHMKRVFNVFACLPLPVLTTDDYYRIICMKRLHSDLDQMNICHLLASMKNLQELLNMQDYANGNIILFDCIGLHLGHIRMLTPQILLNVRTICEKGYKARVKSIHILHPPQFVDILVKLIRQALSTKLKQRIYIHSQVEDLYQVLPKNLLPQDYGGTLGTIEQIQGNLRKKYDQLEDRYNELNTMRVDENLRGKKLRLNENFGLYGNFRQLDVD